jgi:hypothetical protein
MSLDVVVYNRTNSTAVANGDLVLTTTGPSGRDWGFIDARCRRLLNEPGDGGVTIPEDHPNAARLTYRNVVRMTQDGEVVKAFVVNELRDVTASADAAAETLTATGEGLLSRLKEMVRVTPNPINRLPLSYTRRHDWAAPDTPTTGWTDTIYTQDRTSLLGGISNRPVAWPTPVAPNEALGVAWIHTVEEGEEHPSGTVYWHRSFTLTAEEEVAFFCTVADEFALAVDGVELLNERLVGPNSVWLHTWVAAGRFAAGTHTVRIKHTIVNSTGQAGLLFAAFVTGPGGIDELLFVSGNNASPSAVNGGWKALNDPVAPPGQTPGRIIRLGMAEALARGCETPTLNFSDTLDSNGDAWDDTIPLVYAVPTTEWNVLERLTPWVEFEIPDDTYRLDVYNVASGVGSATAVEFDDVIYVGLNGEA